MTVLYAWAARWGIPMAAIADLQNLMEPPVIPHMATTGADGGTGNVVRLEAARKRILLWRNNVGALSDKDGRFVRYGLANDSQAVNKRIKSVSGMLRGIPIGPTRTQIDTQLAIQGTGAVRGASGAALISGARRRLRVVP